MSLVALPDGAVPLVVGTVLALGALTLVLSPLLSGEAEVRAEDEQKAAAEAAKNAPDTTAAPITTEAPAMTAAPIVAEAPVSTP